MASYYYAAVIPARPYRPKDKAKAEAGVLLVERRILAALRRHRFSSLADLNTMIATMLVSLNARRFRKMPGSRRDLFETLDVPELTPLPDQRYEYVNFKLARVNINYHVEVEGHNYSVPYTLVQSRSKSATAMLSLRSSTKASASLRILGLTPKLAIRRSASICRRRTRNMPPGLRNA